ncbi:type III secretion system export apparatus subunit SctS [Motilimonas pumila]|uniref:EscS/YscS/HrcS family type III secretion system export apparatus protein n=1 Tax=Motilimonas pumila TaxID=2303987 RepID=A0A418YE02_9GAMM|nr:type III secretion system export apparatus subunit SctS [Motilimonas pumila]RJG42793.1 EscS/YscS/HrcS family type III secretion system export apparatus protein [Motilimonas pumila]
MSDNELIQHAIDAMMLVLVLSLPPIIAASFVGTLVSLIQALTQVQEQTLSFVLKLVAVIITILITTQWMGTELLQLGDNIFNAIAQR